MIDLVRDVLDTQVLDRHKRPMGKVDGVALAGMGHALLGLLGLGRSGGYVVAWNRMDFSEPGKPRCTCAAGELERFSA